MKCYECKGYGHFGRECPTRIKRESRDHKPPGRTNNRPPHQNEKKMGQKGHERNNGPGKRIRGDTADSSLHVGTPENAVNRPTVSLMLEQGAPSVALEIEGRARRLIVDTGSNISILQPGVSRIEIRDSTL